MAKPIRKDGRRRGAKDDRLPLAKENFVIIGIGLLVIVLGYLAMLQGTVEGFFPLVVAPVLLVTGYCVIIPVGLIYRKGLFRRAGAQGESASKA